MSAHEGSQWQGAQDELQKIAVEKGKVTQGRPGEAARSTDAVSFSFATPPLEPGAVLRMSGSADQHYAVPLDGSCPGPVQPWRGGDECVVQLNSKEDGNVHLYNRRTHAVGWVPKGSVGLYFKAAVPVRQSAKGDGTDDEPRPTAEPKLLESPPLKAELESPPLKAELESPPLKAELESLVGTGHAIPPELDTEEWRHWTEERDDTLAYLEHQQRRLEQLGNRDGRETALAFCRRMLARIEAGEHEGARARATEPAGQEGSGENE